VTFNLPLCDDLVNELKKSLIPNPDGVQVSLLFKHRGGNQLARSDALRNVTDNNRMEGVIAELAASSPADLSLSI
jgi:hypothetical protein